jgi:hypothetical protein
MKRTAAFVLALLATGLWRGAAETQESDRLYRAFQDPPRTYSVRPFWFWNDRLDAKEIEWQIEQMVAQGVYGAYLHPRAGLDTPYLSEDYFRAVGAGLEKARRLGFSFGFVDEYEWPSGEARDIWIPGLPSRVIAANPDLRMKTLAYMEKDVVGPATVETGPVEGFQFALAARLAGEMALVPGSLINISSGVSEGRLRWTAPEGKWRTWLFHLRPAQGRDGGLVDLLNPAAARSFLELSYEQYYRRFRERFGTTIDSTYVDHEGDYGYRIAWTPQFFDIFLRLKGYDIRPELPLLWHEGGPRTPKVRCDYMDVISGLYAESFFGQVTRWCDEHGIRISGHLWEETLQMEAAYDGDLQRVMRAWSWPGVDSLWERGRSPRDFKVAASVAHFRGTRFTCENQGLQGSDSFLDFQKMRLGTNMIAAWGANLLIPHAFNYSRRRVEWPPDWFFHQPWWKYFRTYADYARRLSFMNDQGAHVADVLLFQPTESAWAHADPAFSNRVGYAPSKFNNPLDGIDADYGALMNRLAEERWDFDVADSHFLQQSTVADNKIRIGNESFRVLVLPPATTVRRSTTQKIREFFDAGGIVLALRMLPADSMDAGCGDPVIAADLQHVFGSARPEASSRHDGAHGGRGYFIKGDAAEIPRVLSEMIRPDVAVTAGEPAHLYALHRRKEGSDFYWMVNDTPSRRENAVRFSAAGQAEKWDATDASRAPLLCRSTADGTEVRLRFEPWEAYYVVFDSGGVPPVDLRLVRTNLENVTVVSANSGGVLARAIAPTSADTRFEAEFANPRGERFRGAVELKPGLPVIDLTGSWKFRIGADRIEAPYALHRPDPEEKGEALGWPARDLQVAEWRRAWLSEERHTVKDWWVAGPFPNEDHTGFAHSYPPEQKIDLQASYPGAEGSNVQWKHWSDSGYAVDLDRVLGRKRDRSWITSYAVTYLHVPSARRAWFHLAADNNARLRVNGEELLNLHIHPFYHEMREDFAFIREVDLKAGWNEVLLKISKCGGARQYGYYLRVTDRNGRIFNDMEVSALRNSKEVPQGSPSGYDWYRIVVPVTSRGVDLPKFKHQVGVFYNGARIQPDASGRFLFPGPASGRSDILAVQTRTGNSFAQAPWFVLGDGSLNTGSWAQFGLTYFSGSATYERDFTLDAVYMGSKMVLECGEIGVVAEVEVNGEQAGNRVWLPFSFDISKFVRPGKNLLRITVTNTMENARAVENRADRLEKLEPNGLIGPVRIVPYREVTLRCVAQGRN